MSSSDPRDALGAMISSLKSVFKQYDRTARKKAWAAIQTSPGKKEIEQLLDSPARPVNGVPKLLKFKEWLNSQS